MQNRVGKNAVNRERRPALELQVQRTIRKYGMVQPGDRVLVAVSGGADSTALLLCLQHISPTLGLTLVAAHLNHRIRGAEADADEEFVRDFCAGLQVPLLSQSSDVRRSARERRKNLEEAAREERHTFLRRAALEMGAQKVALGHTLNDQAETVLMRLLRGSGLEGLSSIRPVLDGLFIRPLLECGRRQIIPYLDSQGASFREDSSNRDVRYRRNRIRLELIPYLEEHFNPEVFETLGRYAAMARGVSDYLTTQARQSLEALRTSSNDGVSLSVGRLLQHHPAMQSWILRLAIKESRGSLRGIAARHIEDLLALCRPGKSGRRLELPGKILAIRQFDNLELLRAGILAHTEYYYEMEIPGECALAEAGLTLCAKVVLRRDLPAQVKDSPERVHLDADTLPEDLVVRSRRPGDRYGDPKRRKVKKMMINERIPLRSRATLPMVVARDTIIWIPGFRASEAHVVRTRSQRCVVLEAMPLKSL